MNANTNQSLTDSIRRMPRPQDVTRMTTAELREAFLITALYAPGKI